MSDRAETNQEKRIRWKGCLEAEIDRAEDPIILITFRRGWDWVYANDYQFIYQNARPNLVYSVDHGHFFPGSPEWKQRDLLEADSADIDRSLVSACKLKLEDIKLRALDAVSEETIIQAVAAVPREWGLTIKELLKTSYSIRGSHTAHKFDAVVANGRPYFAAHGISFEVKMPEHLQNSLSWKIVDVKQCQPDIPLAIMALRPKEDVDNYQELQQTYQQAASTYSELGATVIEEGEVESWVIEKLEKVDILHR